MCDRCVCLCVTGVCVVCVCDCGVCCLLQIRTIDRGVEIPHEGAFCGEWG